MTLATPYVSRPFLSHARSGDEALVTLTQAATGTGKTVALLAPILALAGPQKRQGVRSHRATPSTYTKQLTRQILEDDAPRVSRALESLGYPPVSVATRAGRRQFIDPDRVQRSLARLGDRRDGPDGRSLESLGAVSTFAEAEDHGVYLPPEFTVDALCLTPKSSPPAAAAFAACKRAAAEADVVLTNHSGAAQRTNARPLNLYPARLRAWRSTTRATLGVILRTTLR